MVHQNGPDSAPHDSLHGYPMHSRKRFWTILIPHDRALSVVRLPLLLTLCFITLFFISMATNAHAGDLDFAHGLYRQKRFDLAAEEYANYLQANKEGTAATEARFFLAESYVQLKREADALPFFVAVIEEGAQKPGKVTDPQLTQALFRAGQINFNRKQFDDAANYFKQFLERFPDHPLRGQAIYLLAESQLERGDPAGAAEALEKASTGKIEASLADYLLLTRAKLAEQQNRLEDAAAAYRQVIEHLAGTPQDPRLGEAYYRLGLLQYRQKDYSAAAKTLAEGREKVKGQAVEVPMLLQEGICQLLLHQPVVARERLDQLLMNHATHPLAPQALYQLARVGLETSDIALTRSSVDQLAKDYQASPWVDSARVVLGEALLNAKSIEAKTRAEQLQQLAKEAAEPTSREQLSYYAGLAAYEANNLAGAGPLLEPILKSSNKTLRSDAGYVLGLVRMKEEKFGEAIPMLLAFANEREPSTSTRSALVNLATAVAKLPESPDNKTTWDTLLALATKDTEGTKVLLDVGNQLFAQKRYPLSIQAFKAAIAKEAMGPHRVSAQLGLGWSLYYEGNRPEASTSFTQASELAPKDSAEQAEAIYMLGVIAADDGQKDNAAQLLGRVYAEFPTSTFAVEAGLRAANLLAQTGHAEEADKLYESLSKREDSKEKRARAIYDRAWLALDRADKETGAALLRSVVDDPMAGSLASEAAIKLAELLQTDGKLDDAMAMITKADSLNPAASIRPALLYRRGLLLRETAKTDEAKKDFESLLSSAPDSPFSPAALFWLGEIEFEGNRNDTAITAYQRLLERNDSGKYAALAHLRLSQTYLKTQKWDDADAEAAKLAGDEIELPVREEATYVKARVKQQKAEFDAARELYRKIIGPQRTETAAKAQFMLGETFFLQERYDEALKEFLKVEILYPIPEWQSFALLEIGKCHARRSETDDARKAFNEVVEKYPTLPAASEAKRQLESLAKPSETSSSP